MSTLQKPHDALFRKSMENPMVAKEFFETNLPQEILDITDLSSLKMEKDSFIDQELTSSFSDVLFSSKLNGEDGYFYLLVEHQSKPDHFMAFRLFKYMINICDRYLEQNPKKKYIPLVYPLIFYTGSKNYNAPRNLWKLYTNSELAKKFWAGDYPLINLHGVPDHKLKEHIWSGLMSFFLKHINEPNLINRWEEIKDKLPQIAQSKSGYDYIKTVLLYTLTKIDANDRIKLEKMLKTTLNQQNGEELMASLARQWYHEGEEKGINLGVKKGIDIGVEKNKEETVINLLKEGCDIGFIMRVTGLTIDQIEKIKASI